MRRIDIDGEGNETDANRLATLSGSDARRLDAVIQFPLQSRAAAMGVSAATGSPPPDPVALDDFIPVGHTVLPVVLRMKHQQLRLKIDPVPALGRKDRVE